MEEWRVITEFPNYSISNLGNVLNTLTNKIMKLNKKGGYYQVALTHNKNKKIFSVHRLVAVYFIPNPENKSDVNHKDKNKLNNNLSNLEWMTRKENNLHRCKDIIIKTNKNKHVNRIDKNTNEIIEKYNSIEDAGIWCSDNKLTSNSHNGRNAIGNCVNGLSNSAYGFAWEFEKKDENTHEEWREINPNNLLDEEINTNKKYYVSNLGRFKNSFGTVTENYKVNENGYIRVFIYNKTFALHRLIAFTFIENPDNKEQVNHIDGNKLNNSVDNLEWVTNKENQIHKFQIGLGNNFTRFIKQYDLEGKLIKEFKSIADASRILKIGKSNIHGVLQNKRKTAAGFIWKYLEDENPDFSEKITINKNVGRKVCQYDLDMNLLNIYDSMADAARKLNIHKNNIRGVIINSRKTAGGFIFKYLDE
jgi:hypothetical protein